MAIRYTEEQKADALKRVGEIGAPKASEELHISIQTLYKWKNEGKGKAPGKKTKGKGKIVKLPTPDNVKGLLEESNGDKITIKTLKEENEKLRTMNERLRNALSAFIN